MNIRIPIVAKMVFSILIFISFVFPALASTNTIKITVPEPVPGATCERNDPKAGETLPPNTSPTWTCETERGTAGAIATIKEMIRFFAIIVSLVGVLFLVYNGILYSMGGLDQSLKEESKKRIIATLLGLLLLFSSGYILQTIAPWIFG